MCNITLFSKISPFNPLNRQDDPNYYVNHAREVADWVIVEKETGVEVYGPRHDEQAQFVGTFEYLNEAFNYVSEHNEIYVIH